MQTKGFSRPIPVMAFPYHLARHMANLDRVPRTHFSILQEMTMTLVGPLEFWGYRLPESLVPDISQGKMFAKHLQEHLGIDPNTLPTYSHLCPDGREIPGVKMYPVEYLGEFRRFINEIWLPRHAMQYFEKRDSHALPYIEKLLRQNALIH